MTSKVIVKTVPTFLELTIDNGVLTRLLFIDKKPLTPIHDPAVQSIVTALNQYFNNPRSIGKINLSLKGTPFQQRVWNALAKIPCGTTKTYGELAESLKTSARAIGNACRANPVPLFIPCHRVVAKAGIGGFAGDTDTEGKLLTIKKWLLAHEK